MSYLIDGRPLTKRTRPELLALCKRLYEQGELAQITRSRAIDDFRIASGLRDMAEIQRDQALHECDVLRVEQASLHRDFRTLEENYERALESRDSYKKESTNHWLKLTAAESALSVEQARVVVLRRRVKVLRRWIGLALLAAVVVVAIVANACTASPTSPQPVCREYGFSPTSGRDTVLIVPCGGK